MLFPIFMQVIYLTEDSHSGPFKRFCFPRDEVIKLLAGPNDGTFFYVPRNAREAVRLFAATNELIMVY